MKNRIQHRLAAIVFADIVGYSKLSQNDHAEAISAVEHFKEVILKLVQAHQGEIVNFYGDGCLCIFESVRNAVSASLSLQDELANSISVRVGVHVGEIQQNADSVYGNAVNITSRVQQFASSGGVAVTETVIRQISNHKEFAHHFHGLENLKNIDKPHRIYHISWANSIAPKPATRKSGTTLKYLPRIAIALGVCLAVFLYFTRKSETSRSESQSAQKFIVLPFENRTGDSSLTHIGHIASYHLSSALKSVDVQLASYDDLLQDNLVSTMSLFSSSELARYYHAENILEGFFSLRNGSNLEFSCVLKNGLTGEPIIYFPNEIAPDSSFHIAIEKLSKRITGYLKNQEDPFLSPIPDIEALKLLIEALRSWSSDNIRTKRLLKKAITLDSSFVDPHFYLFDVYHGERLYDSAALILEQLNHRIGIENFNSEEQDRYRYQEAILNGKYQIAFDILEKEFIKNPSDPYLSAPISILALSYLNEPELALNLMNKLSFDSIDFENNYYLREMINVGIKANFLLGRFEEAFRVANYYPESDLHREHIRLQARAMIALEDTSALNKLVRRNRIVRSSSEHSALLLAICKDLMLLQKSELHHYYLLKAQNFPGMKNSKFYSTILQDLGLVDQSLDFLENRSVEDKKDPYHNFALARAYALLGDANSVKKIEEESMVNPSLFDYGRTSYDLSVIYAILGKHEIALVKLAEAINQGLIFQRYNVDNEPDLMPLFDLPEYKRIVHPWRN